ncbi:phosphatase domain-containing protein [Desulfobacula sp.]|uniref:phosphatase domain-containing protein n=1 Tax=Desulfobacula sp. TaxID=2593537 RepID=UPI00260C9450|nr:phosphatase domain-containing protein [Desulfobacula sp.]
MIEGDIRLSQDIVDRLISSQNTGQLLRFQAVSKNHMGVGYVTIIPPKGLSVISDIDDTVKITQIPDGESMVLKNTFFRHFVAAPCMAHMYNTFGKDTAFHYVSGGPWQMYQPIYDFLFSKYPGFPRGSFHMKNLRTNPLESESYKDFWRV